MAMAHARFSRQGTNVYKVIATMICPKGSRNAAVLSSFDLKARVTCCWEERIIIKSSLAGDVEDVEDETYMYVQYQVIERLNLPHFSIIRSCWRHRLRVSEYRVVHSEDRDSLQWPTRSRNQLDHWQSSTLGNGDSGSVIGRVSPVCFSAPRFIHSTTPAYFEPPHTINYSRERDRTGVQEHKRTARTWTWRLLPAI